MRLTPGRYLFLFVAIFGTAFIVVQLLSGGGQTIVLSPATLAELAWLGQTRAGIVEVYHVEDVNLSLDNGHVLTVTFVNTGFNTIRSDEEKKMRAREVAKVTKSRCPHIDQIDTICVSFTVDSDYIIFHTDRSETFSFKKADLEK